MRECVSCSCRLYLLSWLHVNMHHLLDFIWSMLSVLLTRSMCYINSCNEGLGVSEHADKRRALYWSLISLRDTFWIDSSVHNSVIRYFILSSVREMLWSWVRSELYLLRQDRIVISNIMWFLSLGLLTDAVVNHPYLISYFDIFLTRWFSCIRLFHSCELAPSASS